MAAKSRHIGDIFIWIGDVIDSLDHPTQVKSARNLINSFDKMMDRQTVHLEYQHFLISKLRDKLDEKRFGDPEKIKV